MADDEHLKILKQGVEFWNEWREAHPDPEFWPDLADANLTKADLTNANLMDADLTNANLTNAHLTTAVLDQASLRDARLTNADLTNADLTKADLTNADLAGANLSHANLTMADLTNADLAGANLSYAQLTDAHVLGANFAGAHLKNANLTKAIFRESVFKDTVVNSETQGLDRLTKRQKAGLIFVEKGPDAVEQSGAPSWAAQITVASAKRIIGPAHEVLSGLPIPNDLTAADRDLFLEFRRSIEDLEQSLADLKDENRRLSDESEELRQKLDAALPLWKRAWETFVLKGAEVAGGGAVFIAGCIAGATYNAFTTEAPGIPI